MLHPRHMVHHPPSFFIIGERKCGTSSLYRYLIAHPNVLPCSLKEPNFFGQGAEHVKEHIDQYWALFPKLKEQGRVSFHWPELDEAGVLYHENLHFEREAGKAYITGEASANTFYEVDPGLVKTYLPEIKLILLFRNPVDRVFSHYRMYQRFLAEGRKLAVPIQDFQTDMEREIALIRRGEPGHFLSPGIYLRQLKKWTAVFAPHQIKVYFTEILANRSGAEAIMEDIQVYLNLPQHPMPDIIQQKFNVAPLLELKAETRKMLESFYAPYNNELSEYLQKKLPF